MARDPNRDLAEQRFNMGKDPGGAYGDLSQKYQNQQESQRRGQEWSGGGGGSGSGGGGKCFSGDTRVLTPSGWREIRSIEKGELVLSLGRGGELTPREVLRKKTHATPARIWEIRVSALSRAIRTTKGHRFLTQRGWVRTQSLVVGDTTHVFEGASSVPSIQEVVSIEATSSYEPTFNLVAFGEANFVINGAVAHSYARLGRVRSFIANEVHEAKNRVRHLRLQRRWVWLAS